MLYSTDCSAIYVYQVAAPADFSSLLELCFSDVSM